MTPKEIADFAVALTQAAAWPIAAMVIAFAVRKHLRALARPRAELSYPPPPDNHKAASEALANLAAASASPKFVDGYEQRMPDLMPIRPAELISVTSKFSRDDMKTRFAAARVLWVDGHPENNFFEQKAFASFNIKITPASGTGQALAELARGGSFDLVISDMKRSGSTLEGYKLISALRSAGLSVPVVLYSLATDEVRRAEARLHGALDRAGSPVELFETVMAELTKAGV